MKSKKFWWFVLAVVVFLLEYEAFFAGILPLSNTPNDLLDGAAVVLVVIWVGALVISGAFFSHKIFPSSKSSLETKQNEK